MVETEPVQNRGVLIVDTCHVLDGPVAELVDRPEIEVPLPPSMATQLVNPAGLWSWPLAPFWKVGIRPYSVTKAASVWESWPRSLESCSSRTTGRLRIRPYAEPWFTIFLWPSKLPSHFPMA